ncbi:TcpE family conjugal transfer membrane protein [Streptosporangium sp. NPDC051022]|uniref:TcpE family conjugal transfer membrane protein n=1 Tax=Streptosporangium sp. NPDC051022 TaxID=3155752 RepID=UPI003434B3C4
MDLPTYTNIWRIEKRLYKLYDLRLPMPLPIVWIGVFVGVVAPWSLLLALLGLPFDAPWHVVYLVPPGIVTWLSTRPVIESKRLTELLQSQVRYMGEPRTWCRMAPTAEPSDIALTGRVWRAAPQRAEEVRGRAARKARQKQKQVKRATSPAREVRPAVAAAAAAAATAPVARERTARATAPLPRRGTAPALGHAVSAEAPGGAAPVTQAASVPPATAPAPAAQPVPAPATPVERIFAQPSRAFSAQVKAHDDQAPAAAHDGRASAAARDGGASAVPAARNEPDPAAPTAVAPAVQDAPAAPAVSTAPGAPTAPAAPVAAEIAASAAPAAPAAQNAPIGTEALRRLRRLAASAEAERATSFQAESPAPSERTERSERAENAEPSEGAAEPVERAVERTGTERPERTVERAEAERVEKTAERAERSPAPEAPAPEAAASESAASESERTVQRSDRLQPVERPTAAPRFVGPAQTRPAQTRSTPARVAQTGPAPVGPAPVGPVQAEPAQVGTDPAGPTHIGPRPVEPAARGGDIPSRDIPVRDVQARDVPAGETTRDAHREAPAKNAPAGADENARAQHRRGQPALAEQFADGRRPHPQERSAGTPGGVSIRAVPSGPAAGPGPVVPTVPVPRPTQAEPRVRRVESVVGRDSAGGWRRLAQVVIGPGGGSRTDGSEIDEARAKAAFTGSRRVVVLGCTGGAGQTTTALMLGHTLARYREDRVLAVDANTGANALSSRIQAESPETLTSLLAGLDNVHGYLGMRAYTSRCASGLEVLAGDADSGAEQRLSDRTLFSDRRLGRSMDILDRHYKLIVVDPAAALAARVLPYADQLVLVVPASEDGPDAVAMTYEWLDGHGCADLRRRAIMVVNGVSRRSMGDVEQAEAVARGRCRAIVRVPWEDELAPGRSERVEPSHLRAPGRRAYLALAGVVVAGFGAAQAVRPSEEEVAQ